jgi:hypothetical protein
VMKLGDVNDKDTRSDIKDYKDNGAVSNCASGGVAEVLLPAAFASVALLSCCWCHVHW